MRNKPFFIEHEGNRIAREGKWKLVSYFNKPWELFDLDADRSESTDLAERHPNIVDRLDSGYSKWAKRVGVIDWEVSRNYSVYRSKKKTRGTKKR